MSPNDAPARPFLTALRDRWWIVALCSIAAGLATWSTVLAKPGQYEAGAILSLKNQYVDRDIFSLSGSQKTTEQTLAEQPGQLDTFPAVIELAKKLGLQPATDARELAANTSVTLDTRVFLPLVQGRDRDPERAAELANAFAEVIAARRARQDKTRISRALGATRERLAVVVREYRRADNDLERADAQREITRLSSALVRLRMLREYRPATISIARRAEVPTARTRAPAVNLGLVGALFGAMMGCALLGWREQRDRRPRPADVLADLQATILTELPRSALLPGARPDGPFAQELAALDAVRLVLQADEPHTTVAVTEAVTLGRAGTAALLLADTAVHQGIRTLLATNDPRRTVGEHAHGLHVERYPIEIGTVAREWLEVQRANYELVIVDLPSPVGSAAALEFASLADRVLVVWVADSITRRQVARLGRTLRRAGIPLTGIVRVGGQPA